MPQPICVVRPCLTACFFRSRVSGPFFVTWRSLYFFRSIGTLTLPDDCMAFLISLCFDPFVSVVTDEQRERLRRKCANVACSSWASSSIQTSTPEIYCASAHLWRHWRPNSRTLHPGGILWQRLWSIWRERCTSPGKLLACPCPILC